MEPKEKAKELVERFIPYNQEYQEGTDMQFSDDLEGAKQCALICVDEIIVANPERGIYWNEVKQQINKL